MSQLVFLAVLPGILILIYIFRKDKVEKEPAGVIVKMVLLGAISCIPAAFFEGIVQDYLPGFPEGTLMYSLAISFLVAGFVEESCKLFFLRTGIWNNPAFDYRFDGVVYGVAVAAGFAMFENILYVLEGGISVAVTRAFLAVPLHSFCGAFMGGFFGMAKKHYIDGKRSKGAWCMFLSWIIPLIIHGIYDTFAFLKWEMAGMCLLIFTFLLYIAGIRFINRLAKDDWKMAFRYSSEYAFVEAYEEKTPEKGKGYGIASLMCGIVAYMMMASYVLPSVLAIVFAATANRKLGRKTGASRVGMGLGITSLVINAVIFGGFIW